MKIQHRIILATVLALSVLASHAQPGGMGGPPPGPSMSGSMKKVFGEHTAFSANLEMQYQGKSSSGGMTMPGKMAALDGKSRFEMDMTQMKGGQMSPESAAQMKQMGMGSMITISRPDKKLNYMVYPGLQAYTENPMSDPDAGKPESDFKVEVTELGKETVDGHPCVKNKVIVTDKEEKKHEFTVWNATDLKKFPVKLETVERANTVVMLFKDVKLAKPEASLFEPPSDFKRYESMGAMMQQEMMKRIGGAGVPPAR